MIISRQQFELNDKRVIEKLVIKTPFKYGAVFQDEACFLYFKSGATLLSSPTEKVSVNAAESVLLKCGNYFADLVQKAPSGICEIYAIHLYPEILKEIYKDEIPSFVKGGKRTEFAKKLASSTIISHFIDSLAFYFENPNLVNSDLLALKIKELILLLLQTENAENLLGLTSYLFSPRKASIAEIIETHLYSNLTVSELAKLAGQSLSTFKRDFQAYFKDTPANYIRKKKIGKAAELLAISDLSVSEICYEVGFNELSHFTRSFSQVYHSTPSAYREKSI